MALYSTGGASILSAEQVAALVAAAARSIRCRADLDRRLNVQPQPANPGRGDRSGSGMDRRRRRNRGQRSGFDRGQRTPSKLAGLVVVSNELAADSSPAALQVVGDGLVRDLRRKTDAAYFAAATPNGPAGIASLAASTASAGGAWTNLDWAAAAIAAAENLHTAITAFVTSPATALSLSTLKEYTAAASNKPLLQADPTQPVSRTISGVPLYREPERRR